MRCFFAKIPLCSARKRQREYAPRGFVRTDRESAAHRFREFPGRRKSDSETALPGHENGPGPVITVEGFAHLPRRHPLPFVQKRDPDKTVRLTDANLDLPVRGGVLKIVAKDVP